MNPNQRISILPFPQLFNGNELSLNIVVLPRNQNPLAPAIEQHGTIPDAVPFADAQLSFTANIFDTLNVFPHSIPPVAAIPLTTNSPSSARAIFEAMGSHLQIANPNVLNTNGNVNNPLNDQPEAAETVSRTVKKYLPRSYRGAFNFTSPRHPNALTDDSYYCAVKAAEKVPGFQRSPDVISWGKAIAYLMRQPHLARQAGMIYQTSFTLDPNHFQNGGWLFIDLDVESDFRQQADADHTFVKRYAVRIPALTLGEERHLFAPVLFPVLHKAQAADPDPSPNGNYDEIFREAAEYDDGFAKIVHCQQPPNRDLLLEDNDGAHPTKDVGVRLGWDDEQILIWYVRQLLADPSGDLSGRIDSPLGVFGYCIDVRDTEVPGSNWVSLNHVASNQALTLSRTPNDLTNPIALGTFEGELPFQVYPMQLDGRPDQNYWLPMYFASWNGHSMVLPDEEAALIYQTTNIDVEDDPEDVLNDTGTGVSGPARNQLNQIYSADLQDTELRYGRNYEFRIRMQDLSGGAPGIDRGPVNQTNSDVTSCRFKRYITPNQPRILELMPGGDDTIANSDDPQPITQLNIQRPKLGYPAVVYTGKYNDPIQRLIDQATAGITVDQSDHSVNAEHRVGLGIADPDVSRVEITVELASLKLDKIDSVSGKEDYVHFYTTTRAFPTVNEDIDFELSLNLPIEYRDVAVVHTGDAVDVENDLGLAGDIDTLTEIVLPTGRTARLTIRAICDDGDDPQNYYGFITPGNKVYDNRFGEPVQIMAYSPSIDERNLVIQTAGVPMVQGIFMRSDLNTSFDGKVTTLLFGKSSISKVSNVQQLADQLNIESNSLTLNAPKGDRVVFGCSSRIRHTLAPDNSSLTFASKGDLINHWLVCVSIELDRDWMWDALQTRSLLVRRTKRYTHSETAESTNALVGDIELIKTASFESLHNPDRQFTRMIFIDAVEPNRDELDADGNPLPPDEIDLSYSLEFQFKPGHGNQLDTLDPIELRLPITTPPSQVPKIASVGIAQSPYVHNEKYSSSEPRKRYLWVEFEEAVKDPQDIFFARVLANAPDQLLSNNNPALLAAPQEPSIPLAPEPIRIITEGATNDLAGLNAMQPMEQSTTSDRHFILPLPPGLHANSDEMFGFYTYEFRVGHFRNPDTEEMVWTTAQGRFGRRLRVTGVQHPAPTLTCMPNRDEDKLWVTAPYAVAVHDGKNVTAKPPRTQLWALLYAQVKQADNQAYRNVLLDDRQLDWRIQVKPKRKKKNARVLNRDFVLEQYTDEQVQVLSAITTRNFKYEVNAANVSNILQLVDFTKKNKDSTKFGTTVWTNNEVNQLLNLYCLPEDSDLSVVVVEILPQITNIFDHVSEIEKPRNASAAQTMVQTKSGETINNLAGQAKFARSQSAFASGPSPLDEQLGHHRILRVSPLTEVPEVCCTDC